MLINRKDAGQTSGQAQYTKVTSSSLTTIASVAVTIGLLLATSPAYAQITKLNSVASSIQTALVSVGVSLFTIALLWVGYKMAFDGARWADVANIVYGAILAGGAAGIASFLMSA
jgi:type IV secretion system protein VirB2